MGVQLPFFSFPFFPPLSFFFSFPFLPIFPPLPSAKGYGVRVSSLNGRQMILGAICAAKNAF